MDNVVHKITQNILATWYQTDAQQETGVFNFGRCVQAYRVLMRSTQFRMVGWLLNQNEKQVQGRGRGLINGRIITNTFYRNKVDAGSPWLKITYDRKEHWICVNLVIQIGVPYIS